MLARSERGTSRAIRTFGAAVALPSGSVLATCRVGSTKDSDDEHIEIFRSRDGGQSWSAAENFAVAHPNGRPGSPKLCYLTALPEGRLLAACMWIDRAAHPGKPLFNAETEGCLPMDILLSESSDEGWTWGPWRHVSMPADIGPASLTNPILHLANGALAMSIETNKTYLDRGKWFQKVVIFHSHDDGRTWGPPIVAGEDTTGRIFNWDLRCCVAPDGQIATFAWTYDTQIGRYLNIHRRISRDHGRTWSAAEDLGITDQAGPPVALPDGRVVLIWVDRFVTHSIRARIAMSVDAPFEPSSEIVLYTHASKATREDSTGELLAEMGAWSYGLPYATLLPDGDILVLFYAGDNAAMDIRWKRLGLTLPTHADKPT